MLLRKQKIEERIDELEKMVVYAEKHLEKLPTDGKIRASAHGSGFQYYLRNDSKDKNGIYIKREERKKVAHIIQGEYYKKVLASANRELSILKKLRKVYANNTFENVFYRLPLGKRMLVDPIIESDESFLNKYMTLEYEQPPFKPDDPEYYSDKGERMRSKSEVLIANKLIKLGIPYRYEMPLELKTKNKWGEKIVIHPDFTIIDVRHKRVIYWEHLGRLGDMEYVNKTIRKMREYEKNGIHPGELLIITGESLQMPLDIKLLDKKLDDLKALLED